MFGLLYWMLMADEIAECTSKLSRDMDDFVAAIDKWAEANIGKQERVERVPPILPIGPVDDTFGKEKDCLGRAVDHLVDYDTFVNKYVTPYITVCHHFTKNGCQYNEGGCWGFPDATVGFKTKQDLQLYRTWLKDNNIKLAH